MIQFRKLRINGFKSFADRTELEITHGLNGIVGPNGCGKSNLVEALRWVMGESSAKRMRGDGMEDVIFNGTASRSRRNLAEVSLLLDNTHRTAPQPYNTGDEIEISRKIERDQGSSYKINGKAVRARDVQMLFADTVTGANSPALVSQGRITQIINAKPLDRRIILEESAGISGLYVRRHEAELRLKAADTNLLRVEDVLGSMESRLSTLKRQARQAARYRNLSTQIRQMEILMAYMEWQNLSARIQTAGALFAEAETTVAQKLGAVVQLTKTQETQGQDLPALRQNEARASAALQAQKLALQRLEDEAERTEKLIADMKAQARQNETDTAHETQSLTENAEALERIEREHAQLLEAEKTETGSSAEKQDLCDTRAAHVKGLEEQYAVLLKGHAEAKAQKNALHQRIQSQTARQTLLSARVDSAHNALEALLQNGDTPETDYETDIAEQESQAAALQNQTEEAQNHLDHLVRDIETARTALREIEQKNAEFNAEIATLERFLASGTGQDFPPVLDDMTADEGFEKALSRALGDSLMASLDQKAGTLWQEAPQSRRDVPALPEGAQVLAPRVKAPKALHLALSQIGVVADFETGEALWARLQCGQSLVSKDGMYWRWDGFSIRAGSVDRHAQTLEQKNKLESLCKNRPALDLALEKARKDLEAHLARQEDLNIRIKIFLQTQRDLNASLTRTRQNFAQFRESRARRDSEKNRLEDHLQTAQHDLEEVSKALEADQTLLATDAHNENQPQEEALLALKNALDTARTEHAESVRACDLFVQQHNSRQARLHAMADERINLQNRTIRARERLRQFQERQTTLQNKLAEILENPRNFEQEQSDLLGRISEQEKSHRAVAEQIARIETARQETDKALKETENLLGQAREARAHAQATWASLKEQHDSMRAAIQEKFEMPPQDLHGHSAIEMDALLDNIEGVRHKKESLIKERDGIGPVNLRADFEAEELEKEVSTLIHERNDLLQAIEELRGGIHKINKEARERLLTAFGHVNAHFQRLFLRLFGGGQAHLALIDSEDALGAGLEIYAQPPGKTLQSLSLLSGGEQTMASIALIFAMFLTNPSPICVLDEIDAPLDDANVDRVCTLLEDIAERGETRFLIITHHRLTMARMDRLYGVTMAERGVSQLVSVDLQQSFDFLDEAA